LRGLIGNIRRDGGTPSVDSIATELSSMHTAERAPVLLALQQTHGNRYVQRVVAGIQTKLKVGQPGDKYEQEADRVADAVMRMQEPRVQRQFELEEEEEEEILQAKSREDATHEVTYDLELLINAIRGGGRSLSGSERSFFEPRFGYDFSQVRVQTNAEAAESARMVNARAFTIGQDIFFRQGEYNMSSRTGQELIAHELTHVVQQNGNSYVNSHKSDSKSPTSLSRCGIAPLSEGKSMRAIQRDIDLEEAFQEIPERDREAFRSGAHALSRFRAVIADYSDFENVALSYGLAPHELLSIFMQEGGLREGERREGRGDLPYTLPPAIVRGNQRALVAFHLWVTHGMDDFARTYRKGSRECREQGYPPTDNCPNWGALGSALLHQLRELHVRGLLWNVHGLRPRVPADQLDPGAVEAQLTSQIGSDGVPTPNFVRLAYRIVAASVTMRRMPAHRGRDELRQLGFSETEISGEEVEVRLPSLTEEQGTTHSTGLLPPEVEALFREGEIFGEETVSADEVVARYRRLGFRYRELERAQEQLRIAQLGGNADAVRQAQNAIDDLMRRAFEQRLPVAVARFSMGTFQGYIDNLEVVNMQFQRWNSQTNRDNRGAMCIWAHDMRVLLMTRRPENEQHLLDEIRSSVTEQAVPQEQLRTVLRRFVEGLIAMQDFDGLERLFRFIIDQEEGHAHISNTQDWIVALTERPPDPEGIPPSLYSQLVPVAGLSAIPRQIQRSIRRYGAYTRFSEVLIHARLEQEGEHP
jgi:hypothetical protein